MNLFEVGNLKKNQVNALLKGEGENFKVDMLELLKTKISKVNKVKINRAQMDLYEEDNLEQV